MLRHSDRGDDVRRRSSTTRSSTSAGEKLGTVADVVPDSPDARAAVARGRVRACCKHAHFVPVEGSYAGDDGTIVVPYDKDTVMHAVKAHRDHLLTPDDERELTAYYGLN